MNEDETGIGIARRSSGKTTKARAFTLLELLLVIVILMTLAALVWPNLGNRTSGGKLEFAARQLTSLLRMARSQSMSTGKLYRCRFERDGLRAVIEEETDGPQSSGAFEPLKADWAVVELGADNIKCLAVQFDPWETQLRDQETKVLDKDPENNKDLLYPPLVFYPNGTLDSATILLGNAEGRNFTLTINGLTGQILTEAGNTLRTADNQSEEQ